MERSEEIIKAIYNAIDDFNRARPPDGALEMSPETVLAGENGTLDSMGFVTLVVEVEREVERAFKKTISLMDVVELTGDRPLTVGELAKIIGRMVEP